jgi:ComF family protein
LVLLPVPLSKRRLRARGHNQSAVFATMLSQWTGLPIDTGLRRIRPTTPQTSLDRRHRRQNVSGAFAWTGNTPRRALLVDDVATTYSTLSECAATLRAAGCREVWAITLARA